MLLVPIPPPPCHGCNPLLLVSSLRTANYIDYKALKDLIKASSKEAESGAETSFSPRTTSLTVQRYSSNKDSSEEKFFALLEQEV